MPNAAIFSDLPRSTPKGLWKLLWRGYRASVRETLKAVEDALFYGRGAVRIGADGIAEYVPLDDPPFTTDDLPLRFRVPRPDWWDKVHGTKGL